MVQHRPKEQSYARTPHVESPESNCYGTSIETVPEGHELRGNSLRINGDDAVSDNPDRYKQHGFYFNADNCIACHACEAACAEKNATPAHLAFRSVGYLEGGSYPAYQRLNISMACNHCDDPVCLKGCPTRAYTKFAEYGAVLQDPDICFGCGYCTWVCPYNAPQLDTQAGHVSKCNMCVDRLEVGLKPACAAACLGGALDFGVIETKPENRDQLKTRIPGFPDPTITRPNIRFQQTRSLPREMRRTDSRPLRYERDAPGDGGVHEPRVDPKHGHRRRWNLAGLSTRENPLVVFTLLTQAMVGAFLLLFVGPQLSLSLIAPDSHPVAWPLTVFGMIGIQTFALVLSTLHLGRPHRFYRAFNNLKLSPVSREVASVALFYNFLGVHGMLTGLPTLWTWLPTGLVQGLATFSGWGAVLSGLAALYFMHQIYRIRARPFWNHWQVLTSFFGSMLTLGTLLVALLYAGLQLADGQAYASTLSILAVPMVAGLATEAVGLWFHARDLRRDGGEGEASHYEQTTTFGHTYRARNLGLGLTAAAILLLAMTAPEGMPGLLLWSGAAGLTIVTAIVGRALFYALVIPTTMPGAFFWRNPAFQEQARDSGLAHMPQVGVVYEGH
ncbi:MAG: DmsC/YnfH family molybdoenzyme membrane anchor subunit [Pseudomonadota bacterium]